MVRYAFDLYPRTDPRDGAVVRRFEHLQEASYRAEENGTGSGQIMVSGVSEDADDIDPRGLQYVRVLEIDDSDVETVKGGFWLEQGKFQALTRKETKHLEFGGAGTLAYLQRAVMWSRTYIHGVFTGQDPIGTTWNLANQSSFYANGNHLGAMLWRVIYEAQHFQSGAYTHRHFDYGETGVEHTGTHADDRTESAIPDVVMTFDQNEDSSGNPWTLTAGTFTAQVGESVLSVVRRLMEMGLKVEMDPHTFELNAWEAPHRTDRTSTTWASGKVLFTAPTAQDIDTGNILSDTIRTIRAFIKRSIVLAGSDNVYAISEGATDIPWEGGYRVDTEDTTTAEDVASRQRLARSDAVDHLKVVMKLGNAPLQGKYRPWVHVNPGDLVTVDTGTDQWEFDNTTFPVAALTVELKEGGDWRAIAELGSSFTSLLEPAFQASNQPAHTHPPNPMLCIANSAGEVVTGRLYYTNGDDATSGLTGADYHGDWDVDDFGGTMPRRLRTAPQNTLSNSGTGNFWSGVGIPAGKVLTELFSLPLSASAAVLATIQSGGTFRTVIRSTNDEGIGIDEAAQANYPIGVARVYRPGTGFIGTLFDTSDLASAIRFDVSPGAPYPSIPMECAVAAVPSAVGSDYLLLELGGDHQGPTSGGTGFAYRPADSSAEDLPYIVDSVADQNSWAEFSSAGGTSSGGDGHPQLIGNSSRAKRCDDTEHFHSDREPTVLDDYDQGMRVGTLWLDDTTGRVWWLTDNTAGAAVWILISDPTGGTGGGGGTTLVIQEEDGSPSGTFDTLKVPNATLTDNGDGSASLGVAAAVHAHDPATPGFHGTLVRRTSDFTSTNSNDSVPDFDTADYDTDGMWDAGDPDRLTVPADYDGLMMQLYAAGLWATGTDDYVELKLYRNVTRPIDASADEPNLIAVTQIPPASAYNTQPILISPPVQVATGDEFYIAFRTPASETVVDYHDVSLVFGAWIVGSGGGSGSVTEEDVRDAGRWEVVVSGTAPPVAVSTPDDDDWVYGWVSG